MPPEDQDPTVDPHSECAEEIRRLQYELSEAKLAARHFHMNHERFGDFWDWTQKQNRFVRWYIKRCSDKAHQTALDGGGS